MESLLWACSVPGIVVWYKRNKNVAFVYDLLREASLKHLSLSCWVTVGKSFAHLLTLWQGHLLLWLSSGYLSFITTPQISLGNSFLPPHMALSVVLYPLILWIERLTQTWIITALCLWATVTGPRMVMWPRQNQWDVRRLGWNCQKWVLNLWLVKHERVGVWGCLSSLPPDGAWERSQCMGRPRVRLETELKSWHCWASETSYAEPELAYSLVCRLSCCNKEADICNGVNKIHSPFRS